MIRILSYNLEEPGEIQADFYDKNVIWKYFHLNL